ADARLAYSHALVGGPTELTQDATKRVAAFESYFRLQTQYFKLDSIYSILDIDSLWIKKDTLEGRTKPDSSLGQSMKEQAVSSTRKSRTIASVTRDSTAAPQRDSVLISARVDSAITSAKTDSLRPKGDSALVFARRDTLNARGDTLHSMAMRDSTQTKAKDLPKYWPKPKKDTLIASLGKLSYLTGELFYADLDVPDSAFYWLSKSLKLGIDSIQTPRALYVLAEVARANAEKKYGNEEDLYLLITEKYPKSTYAEESRIALGFRPTMKEVDPAAGVYAVAESLMYAGEHKRALDTLWRIVGEFGESPLVAKSRYTMAWIYENYLARPDSALSQYNTLAQKFAATKYGLAAQKRIPPLEAPVKPAADSLKKALPDSVKSAGSGVPAKALPDSTMKGTKMAIPKIADDSTEHRNITRPPMPDSLRMRFEPDLMQKKPPVEVDTVKREGKKEK
ncbi:MAG: hypothetical protein NTU47_15270, partial [Ignavibacteriales bacterium]|nr:hypothetical protein [Ignavibacteriales bacterium]